MQLEGIGDIMGGKVLDLDIIRIKHEEREEGRKEERKNTERERNRAIAAENRIKDAENRIKELEALLAKAGI